MSPIETPTVACKYCGEDMTHDRLAMAWHDAGSFDCADVSRTRYGQEGHEVAGYSAETGELEDTA